MGMNINTTRCLWYTKIYSSAAGYFNHTLHQNSEHVQHSHELQQRQTPDEPDTTVNFCKLPDNNFDYSLFVQIPTWMDNHFKSDEFGTARWHIYNHWPDSDTPVPDESAHDNSNIEPQANPMPDDSCNANPDIADCQQHIASRYNAEPGISQLAFPQRSLNYNHWFHCLDPRDDMLGHFFTCSKVHRTWINEFFPDSISSTLCSSNSRAAVALSFRSWHTFHEQTTFMIDDHKWKTGIVQYALRSKSEFRYRNML